MNAKLAQFILRRPFGFITQDELPELISLDPGVWLLARCGGCRFSAPANQMAHVMNAVEAAGDYVRDVSFLASDIDLARKTAGAIAAAHSIGLQPDARGGWCVRCGAPIDAIRLDSCGEGWCEDCLSEMNHHPQRRD